ncbi:MAG TPA: siroheme synthase CysG [Candidatus Udaeobacter sp.]|nr:siroheme synthase CysG [Candidatus Udaeobacter sp.]
MEHFPIFLNLKGRPALIVGGGEAAARKLRLLQKAGAAVTVVAPKVLPEIAQSGVRLRQRGFVAGDVSGQAIVFATTGIAEVDDRVAEAARDKGLPWNVTDRAEASGFILPAIVERDPVVIAISSGGAAPALVRRLRERIERLLPARLGQLARFADSFRGAVKGLLPDGGSRRRFWERFFDSAVAEAVLAGHDRRARENMLTLVNGPGVPQTTAGIVHLVGAGPGSPDLLTLRALQVMQRADVVVLDRLVGPQLLDLVRRDAERIHVGGGASRPSLPQAEINALLARLAGEGKCVVRLKSGDPLVFARGGEELAYLRRRGVTVEVVPGITAALGCAAAVGLSLTHRDRAQVVSLVAGETPDGEAEIDWTALARPRQTLAIYMGVSSAGLISRRLIEGGLPANTPVAVVENGTLPDQRGALGRLAALKSLIRATGIEGPAIVFVGDAAAEASVGSEAPRQLAQVG